MKLCAFFLFVYIMLNVNNILILFLAENKVIETVNYNLLNRVPGF